MLFIQVLLCLFSLTLNIQFAEYEIVLDFNEFGSDDSTTDRQNYGSNEDLYFIYSRNELDNKGYDIPYELNVIDVIGLNVGKVNEMIEHKVEDRDKVDDLEY